MPVPTDTYRLKLIFTGPLLGTQPSLETALYMAQKRNARIDEEEAESLSGLFEQSATRFNRTPAGEPALMSYHLLGFFKEAGKALNGKVSGGVRNLRLKVAEYIHISPRVIPLQLPPAGQIDFLERPLRAYTSTGAVRVALVRSEILPEGAWLECSLEVIRSEIGMAVLEDLLDYGYNRGLGQWRSSGVYGTFRYELVQENGKEE